ncbi:transposase, partial [Fulvivirga kasyanovii]
MGKVCYTRARHVFRYIYRGQWIDLFIRGEYREVITDSLKYCHTNKGLQIHAYCIMTSHVHLILSTEEDNKLSDVIRDFKS